MHINVKRRTMLARLAGAPIALSAGMLGFDRQAAEAPTQQRHLKLQTPQISLASFDPRSTALLVMDFQPAWIETIADSTSLLSRAANAIALAREIGMDVTYTRVAFEAADYAAVPQANIIFRQLTSIPGALDDDAPRTAIANQLAPAPDDKVIRKTRVSAFDRTDLDGWLRGKGIDTLILTGISTSGVVLSTVCDGADLDYRLVVLKDACADRDPDIQEVLVTKVFPERAQVVNVADLASSTASGK